MKKTKSFWKILGPGLITGISDTDPSGVATYAQAGAKFGYGLLWTNLYLLPLMVAVQEAAARLGAVKGKGLAGIIKSYYSKKIAYSIVLLVMIANIINLGADLAGMAMAANLIIPVHPLLLSLLFVIIIVALEIFVKYKNYVRFLKWLCIFVLAYPLTLLFVSPQISDLIKTTFIPSFQLSYDYLFILTGVFGTTISPYLFFWEASQEVEELKEKHLFNRYQKFQAGPKFISNMRVDNFIGMLTSQLCAWSIMAIAATVLHQRGIHTINTAADAAKALEPFVKTFPNSGMIAKAIFALGIVGLGGIAIPVLAGSTAYGLSEIFNWKKGLNLKFKSAYWFYGVIILTTFCGFLINILGFNPIDILIFAAVINGIVAVPLIVLIGLAVNNKKIVGKYRNGMLSNCFLIMTFICMLGSVLAMGYHFFIP